MQTFRFLWRRFLVSVAPTGCLQHFDFPEAAHWAKPFVLWLQSSTRPPAHPKAQFSSSPQVPFLLLLVCSPSSCDRKRYMSDRCQEQTSGSHELESGRTQYPTPVARAGTTEERMAGRAQTTSVQQAPRYAFFCGGLTPLMFIPSFCAPATKNSLVRLIPFL